MRRSKNLPCPPAEWALIKSVQPEPGQTVWTTTIGRGQLARHLATEFPSCPVVCWVLDAYVADQVSARDTQVDSQPVSLKVHCAPDWPDTPCDILCVPLEEQGEEELAREILQTGFHHLRLGGLLKVSGLQKSEGWIREQLREWNKSIRATRIGDAVVCETEKIIESKRQRNYTSTLAFRDQERLVSLVTRPGVFAHRKLDLGARQLLNAVELLPDDQLVLDLGCGSGAVGAALALRQPLQVIGVDSNPRALQCTQQTFAANGLEAPSTLLNHDDHLELPEPVDLVVANPPYFSKFRIAEIFCENAARNVRDGGRVFFVAKNVEWYASNFDRWFRDIEILPLGGYHIVRGFPR